jgi:thiol-disulfide isomerase/thioredoxin
MAAAGLVALGLIAATARADEPGSKPDQAATIAAIRAEYDGKIGAMRAASEKAATEVEARKAYFGGSPDVVAFSRRMIDAALTDPKTPAARDALLWVLDHPNRSDGHLYGIEFARAAELLVLYHGDDPEAVRIGLELDNVLTPHRDSLLLGFYAAAKGREAKGLARLALAQYLERKAMLAEGARKSTGRLTYKLGRVVQADGTIKDNVKIDQRDEEYAYTMQLRQSDPEAIRTEARRLYDEVIAEYADVPYITRRHREMETLVKGADPSWNGKPLTEEEKAQLAARLARRSTLGKAAEARLDDWLNLAVGKTAPEIDFPDIEGKPLKLSDFRGKAVVLVFWGSWCGPCMQEVPHERELAATYKGRPFAILGVDCDEPKEVALKAMKENGITWPNWHDGEDGGGPIQSLYHIRSFPTLYVLDGEGKIRAKDARGEGLDKLVETLVVEAEGAAKAK